MVNGAIALNKPAGFTSHDAVAVARRIFKTKKIGHTGTLDPMATGVLVLLVGNAVKASDHVTDSKKSYRASFRLGISTDTEDITGKVTETSDHIPSLNELQKAAKSFEGGYYQTPPMYSALKVNGKKLYEYARKGELIDREPRFVRVWDLSVFLADNKEEFILETSCSKGTYIRTLICDIAKKAGSVAAMTSLVRTFCGGFSLSDCVELEELEKASRNEKADSFVVPTERLFLSLDRVILPDFYKKLALNGQPVYDKRAGLKLGDTGSLVRLCDKNGVFCAVATVIDTDEGKALKTVKQFI